MAGLLSPHRARLRADEERDRRTIADAHDIMWAIDVTQICIVSYGNVCFLRLPSIEMRWRSYGVSISVVLTRMRQKWSLDQMPMAA
jgi:hypothetical protein